MSCSERQTLSVDRSDDFPSRGARQSRLPDPPSPPEYNNLYTASALGGVNGDGVPDIGIGFILNNRLSAKGKVYVAFGKTSSETQSVSDSDLGFVISGSAGMKTGASISPVDDMDGDGRDEVVVGEPPHSLFAGR